MIRRLILLVPLLVVSALARAGMVHQGPNKAALKPATSTDYSYVTFYENCDSTSTTATKATGSATIGYNTMSLATLQSTAPILGVDSWDNNNAGYKYARIATAGNVSFTNGRVGLYFKPEELNSGYILFTTTTTDGSGTRGFYAQWLTPDDIQVNLNGTGTNFTSANLVAWTTYYLEFRFDGSVVNLYINGSAQSPATLGATNTDTYLYFGTYNGNQWDALYDQIICTNDSTKSIYLIKDVTNFN